MYTQAHGKFNFQHYWETKMSQIIVFWSNREDKMLRNVVFRLNREMKMPWKFYAKTLWILSWIPMANKKGNTLYWKRMGSLTNLIQDTKVFYFTNLLYNCSILALLVKAAFKRKWNTRYYYNIVSVKKHLASWKKTFF